VEISPSKEGFDFAWDVGTTYEGYGWFEDGALTVDWGDDHPVVYSVALDGRVLIGTWADGAATELLCRQGSAGGSRALGGEYRVLGTNPDGTLYSGTLTVNRDGSEYIVSWSVGESYRGTGTLSGNVLTVEWDDEYPVVYQLRENGALLVGAWADGGAAEYAWKEE